MKISLPPGLQGATRCLLSLTIDEIVWTAPTAEEEEVQVKCLWWGQREEEAVLFSPVNVKNFSKSKKTDVLLYVYEVRTSQEKLVQYLRDASPLHLLLLGAQSQVIGAAAVANLQNAAKETIDGYYPVVQSRTKAVIANIRVRLGLASPGLEQEKPSSEAAKPASPVKRPHRVTLLSKKSNGQAVSRRMAGSGRPEASGVSAVSSRPEACGVPAGGSKPAVLPNGLVGPLVGHVPAGGSAEEPLQQTQLDEFSPTQKLWRSPALLAVRETEARKSSKVTFSDSDTGRLELQSGPASPMMVQRHTSRIADSLVTQLLSQSQALRESMQKRYEEVGNDEQLNEYSRHASLRVTANHNYRQENGKEAEDSQLLQVPACTNWRGKENHPPSESANKVDNGAEQPPTWNISVARMKILARVTQLVLVIDSVSLSPVVMERLQQGSIRVAGRQGPHSGIRRPIPPTFCVRFRLPGEKEESSLCSKRVVPVSSIVEFKERKKLPVVFNSKLLEDWWCYDLDLKIFSRDLNQRVPTSLGTASFGLKHLLISDKYSSGSDLSLPLYASQSLFRELKLAASSSEIVGNIRLCFLLESAPYLTGGGALAKSPDKMVISAAETDQRSERRVRTLVSNSSRNGSGPVPQPPFSFSQTVFFYLRVTAANGDRKAPIVKYRNFEGAELKADLAAGQDLQESVPLFLPSPGGNFHNRQMLSRLKDNFIIFEAWSGDTLLGVARLATQPIYELCRQGDSHRLMQLHSGPLTAYSILEREPVARLHVALHVGTHRHVAELLQQQHSSAPGHGERPDVGQDAAVQTSFSNARDKEAGTEAEHEDEAEKEIEEIAKATETEETDQERKEADKILVDISIDEARNLPLIRTKEGDKLVPRCYVSLPDSLQSTSGHFSLETSSVESTSPVWEHCGSVLVEPELLLDPRRHLILKIWHQVAPQGPKDREADQMLGYAAVDLSPLLASFPSVTGWYNIINWVGRCRGQIKVSVLPRAPLPTAAWQLADSCAADDQPPVTGWQQPGQSVPASEFLVGGSYMEFPSHLVQHTEQLIRSLSQQDLTDNHRCGSEQSVCSDGQYWRPPALICPTDPSSSFLERSLQQNLRDLDRLSQTLIASAAGREQSSHAEPLLVDSREQTSSHGTFTVRPIDDPKVGPVRPHQPSISALRPVYGVEDLDSDTHSLSSPALRTLSPGSIEELPRDQPPDQLVDLGLLLGDLGLGWATAPADTDRSRVGPEGGNPLEEVGTTSSRHQPPDYNDRQGLPASNDGHLLS